MRCAYRGDAAAQSPNAPSTCSHAPDCSHRYSIGSSGSNAPVFTLPACAHTIAGPASLSSRASASGSIAPCSSVATSRAASRPSPIIRSALKTVACASCPAITVTGGAPISPWPAASHPARLSTTSRATARQVTLAICAPVTSPTLAVAGSPSSESTQSSTTSSTTDAAGEPTHMCAF